MALAALTPIEEFNDYFKATFSDEEFDTIGGIAFIWAHARAQRGDRHPKVLFPSALRRQPANPSHAPDFA